MRTRFAPSPTGPPHLGSLHTALFAFLAAKHSGGMFIVRIDDTDPVRSSPQWETEILNALEYLGISWDEGPDIPGEYGPCRQSERRDDYERTIGYLKEEKYLYPCFCTESDLAIQRAASRAAGRPYIYGGKCRGMSGDKLDLRIRDGVECVWRFHADPARLGDTVEFTDLVFGAQSFQTSLIGDFVCIRGDGNPTYMLVSPLDDASMKITHIIRGSDHLPNTPAQILLLRAIGSKIPHFAHLPLITGKKGKKLSKRDSMTGLEEIKQHLPAALVNHLALLGWTHPGGKEILSLNELISAFSFERISTSPAAHDPARLAHLERAHLATMSPGEILKAWSHSGFSSGERFFEDAENSALRILGVVKDELTSLKAVNDEILPLVVPPGDVKLRTEFSDIDSSAALAVINAVLIEPGESRMELIEKLALEHGKRNVYLPLRIALTGMRHGFELRKLLQAFSSDEAETRLSNAVTALRQ